MDPPTTSTATEETARLAKAEIDSTRDPLATCFNADLQLPALGWTSNFTQEKRGEKRQAEINDGGSSTKCIAAKSKPLVAAALAVTSKASSSLEGESHGFNTASKEKIPEGAAMKAEVTAARTTAEFEKAVSLLPGAIDESNKTLEQAIVVLKRRPGATDASNKTLEPAIVVLKRLSEDQVDFDDVELSAAAKNYAQAGAALQQVILEAECLKKASVEAIEEADGVGADTDAAKDIAAKASAEMILQLEKLLKSLISSPSC